jgi:hypothetical protein
MLWAHKESNQADFTQAGDKVLGARVATAFIFPLKVVQGYFFSCGHEHFLCLWI